MIAARVLSRPDWEAILRSHGCEPCAIGDARAIQTAEWWKTEHIKLFTVPIDHEERIGEDDLRAVLVEVGKLKPLDWDT